MYLNKTEVAICKTCYTTLGFIINVILRMVRVHISYNLAVNDLPVVTLKQRDHLLENSHYGKIRNVWSFILVQLRLIWGWQNSSYASTVYKRYGG